MLRRAVLAGALSRDVAALAHGELARLRVTMFGFGVLADRVWELHPTVTAYDAAYVALAEALEAPLLTLDRRLARADGRPAPSARRRPDRRVASSGRDDGVSR